MPDTRPRPYLQAAERLLQQPGATGYRGWWPRAVVWLLRIQLEQDIEDYLQAHGIPADDLPGRTRLLLLHGYLEPADVQHVTSAWYGLSHAGHHHAYELAPTHAELRGWLQAVKESPLRSGQKPAISGR